MGNVVIGQHYEEGWRSLSLYAGVSEAELHRAAEAREFAWYGPVEWPMVAHEELDAWLLLRSFGPKLLDDLVKLTANIEKAS
jgi:hypothetical protein